MTAAERIQEKIQKLRALHAVLTGALNELSYDFHRDANKVVAALPALLDAIAKGVEFRKMIGYGPFDAAAHFGPDFDLEEAQQETCAAFDAALDRLGEPDA